ncbi:MAG: DUF4920 domain-containing protein [Myxococcales bacterium]|nr:DUF4920 domain-containing protein [Myxococcales bacterium]MCB9567974.1 DUF4920 domain-containing protein [Myxococcales bacterium]MCB9700419.1 DUF4920 domain-containing protein [Myxococcales bacterium]
MNLRIAAIILFGSATLAACGGQQGADKGEPKEAAKVEEAAKADGEKVAKADGEPEKAGEGEEGCIYGENHGKKEHAEEEGEGHSCNHGNGEAAPAGEPGHYGAAFALGESKPLGEVLASAGDAPSADPIQVSGTIDSVCQKMGCWMVLADGEGQKARIMMKDHSFTVPMDTKGKPAIVEGVLTTRTFNEKEVKHLEKDGGGDPEAVGGDRKEFVLTATGIKIPTNS